MSGVMPKCSKQRRRPVRAIPTENSQQWGGVASPIGGVTGLDLVADKEDVVLRAQLPHLL